MFGKASAVLSAVLPSREFGRRLLQVLSAGMLLPFLFAGHASAATLTVTTLNDSGAGSLRAAITSASAGDAIVFQSGLTGTITLASALPAINANLTIQGPGADSLTISGNNAVTVFTINSGTVSISGLTIANGNSASGAGIFNHATLTVTNSTFSGNSAAIYGGGIYNVNGTVTVVNSTFSNNSAGSFGGGIFINSGTVKVNNSTFSANSAGTLGGGISNVAGVLTINNSIFVGNTASSSVGGIDNEGTTNASNTLFWKNTDPQGESDCPACTRDRKSVV